MHSQPIRVVGLGQASVDYLGALPHFPAENRKAELTGLAVQCGGPACTALVTLARLGIPAAFLGSIADDALGQRIRTNLQDRGIDISQLKVSPDCTSQFAFIAVTPASGHRTIFWHRGTAPPLAPADVHLERFPGATVLHLDGLMHDASREAARQARRAGLTVVMDAGTLRERSAELLPLVDVLIASETFAEPLVGQGADPRETLEVLRAMGPGRVVVTLGARGSVGRDAFGFYVQEAFPVQAVDTTGAGDVYHGAFIYGLLEGWEMPACLRFASAVAALKCLTLGAQAGIPDLAATRDFLAQQN